MKIFLHPNSSISQNPASQSEASNDQNLEQNVASLLLLVTRNSPTLTKSTKSNSKKSSKEQEDNFASSSRTLFFPFRRF